MVFSLNSKFGDRIILRRADTNWPVISPAHCHMFWTFGFGRLPRDRFTNAILQPFKKSKKLSKMLVAASINADMIRSSLGPFLRETNCVKRVKKQSFSTFAGLNR
jgi:hypothetical protein